MALDDVFATFTTVFYIIASFGALVLLRDRDFGLYLLILTLYGPWISDVFAYFCGRLFGRHKLIPDVSPKKTVEGSVGGIVFCMIAMVIFGLVCDILYPQYNINLWVFALGGLIASVVAQIGDLLMSVIKRTYGIKDYGKLFPGHGGMLDRFDSVLAVAVVLAVFCSFFDFFEVI